MRKSKKKLDLNRRKSFCGFEKLIFLSMVEKFNKNFVYFPFRRIGGLNQFLITNRCAYSGRSRGVFRRYRLCRGALKHFIHLGHFSGVRRKTW